MVRPHTLIGLPIRPSLSLGQSTRAVRTPSLQRCTQRRDLYTLGIETSCDDTCVAIMERHGDKARLLWQYRIPCPNKKYEGIHPLEAVESHVRTLPGLIQEALRRIGSDHGNRYVPRPDSRVEPGALRPDSPKQLFRPDLIAVTRGPGMKSCLSIGISAAKALSAALCVPLIGVHHMQAHALTPQMESELGHYRKPAGIAPKYPFLTLLVSGGHTMLLHTLSSTDHRILASTSRGSINPQEKASPVAVGDMLDKCARVILPDVLVQRSSESIVYARALEQYVAISHLATKLGLDYKAPAKREDEIQIYNSEAGWAVPPPLRLSREMKYDFSGLGGMVRSIMQEKPDMKSGERAELGYHTMRLAFEHLGSRVILALQNDEKLLADPPKHLVLSGGVASNMFLRRVIEEMLKARGFGDIRVIAPSTVFCTDNAAMIAWTGAEMYQAGWTTSNDFLPKGEWPIEQIITDTDCWIKSDPPLLEPKSKTDGQQTTPTAQEPPEVMAAEPPLAPSRRTGSKPAAASDVPDAPAKPSPSGRNKMKPIISLDIEAPQQNEDMASREARLQEIEQKLWELQQLQQHQLSLTRPPRSGGKRARNTEGPPPQSEPARQPSQLPSPRQPRSPWSSKPTKPSLPRGRRSPLSPERQGQEEQGGPAQAELLAVENQLAGSWARRPSPAPPRPVAGSPHPQGRDPRGGGDLRKPTLPQPTEAPPPGRGPLAPKIQLRVDGALQTPTAQQQPDRVPRASTAQQRLLLKHKTVVSERTVVSEKGTEHGTPRTRSGRPSLPRNSTPWKSVPEGEEEKKKQHMVRPLRQLQPELGQAAEQPSAGSGPLRKRFDALRKWAGL